MMSTTFRLISYGPCSRNLSQNTGHQYVNKAVVLIIDKYAPK